MRRARALLIALPAPRAWDRHREPSLGPVYRLGREAGVSALRLAAGDRVLDVGCGTGLSLPLLRAAVGPGGSVVGLDASPVMLRQAAARIRHGWHNVDVVRGDAADPSSVVAHSGFDALLFTYALSVIDDWQAAWREAFALLRHGGRVAVVDLAPNAGGWRWLAPVAWLACFAGGSDPHRHPWTALRESTADSTRQVLRGRHIVVAAGTRPTTDRTPHR